MYRFSKENAIISSGEDHLMRINIPRAIEPAGFTRRRIRA
jgi:hypothetical protein